jgi:hypothetical protein
VNSRIVFTFLFAAALGVGAAQGQETSGQEPVKAVPDSLSPPLRALDNGQWWMNLSANAKDAFVDGYKAAMKHVSNKLSAECDDGLKNFQPGGIKDPDFKSIIHLCKIGQSFDFTFEQREIRTGLDEYYKDSKHASVPIDDAIQRVRDTLKSKRPNYGIGGGIGGH